MNPTAGNLEILPFISEFVIDLITVRNNGAGEVFQEFPWMVGFSGSLPIEKNDRVFFATPKYLKMQNAFPKVAAGNSSFLHVSPA